MSKQPDNLPEIVDKDEAEINEIIALIKNSSHPEEVKTFIIKCIELAIWLPLFLQKKRISLSRLRTMIFGKGYNKKSKIEETSNTSTDVNEVATTSVDNNESPIDKSTESDASSANRITVAQPQDSNNDETTTKPGHGRMPHTVYEDFTEVQLQLLKLTKGSDCPELCGGKLGNYKAGLIVRIKGQNFAQVYKYSVEKLRCNLCGIIISAGIPAEVGDEKYDESFKAMLALMKYYMAMPFYRQEQFQGMLKFPLSDATQWDLIESLAGFCYPVFNKLKLYAANGSVIHNDDTSVRILEVIKLIKEGLAGKRSGMYTTGIVGSYEQHPIALFLNGRQHAGENLQDIIKHRCADKGPIIQMCDALSANIPKEMQTILCNCLSHGFRKFEELVDFFTTECLIIMKKLSQVFEFDTQSRNFTSDARLAHHQKHSKPVMDELKKYMASLLDEHLVEPNSDLGAAIKYMQNHWPKLTRFLTVVGAPIDNNVVERALKVAIRNRKAAMFYRSTYSAYIGGMLTSLIYTCHMNNENPHDYLVALQIHQPRVTVNPERWMPWNYLDEIAKINAVDAIAPEHSPPPDYLVAA